MIDISFIADFLKKRDQVKSDKENVKTARAMRVHAEGKYPEELIDERRPNESEEIKKYRKKIFKSMTKAPFDKILNVLMRMRKADDWKITYPDSPSIIPEGETLRDYCEINFPKFNSVTEWMFQYGLKEMLIDPNSIAVVMPLEAVPANEYTKPFILLFKSDQILDYTEEEQAVLLSATKSIYYEEKTKREGKIYYFLDRNTIWESKQTASDIFETKIIITHNIGYLPAVKMGGLIQDIKETGITYASFLSGVLPYWEEAAREFSDLQAEVVQHVHSEKWRWAGQDCTACSGSGKEIKNGDKIICSECGGKGTAKITPYSVTEIKGANEAMGEKSAPIPPGGYIQKQVEIVTIQDERIQNHITRGYAAINFEFLASTPLNQSGLAKNYDRQELNSFIFNVASHVVKILRDLIFFECEYRYMISIPSKQARAELLPDIAVPQKFDVLSETYIIEEINKASTGKVSPVVINQLQIEYVAKKFNNDPEMRSMLADILDLNPLSGKTPDDMAMAFNNKWITRIDCIIAENIVPIVTALYQDPEFKILSREDKLKKVSEKAASIETLISAKQAVLEMVNPGGGVPATA